MQPPLASVVSYTGVHILRQSPTAPRLRAYRVAFWAKRGTQTTIGVNYRRVPGQFTSDPFLRFKIPINGLVAGAGGVPLGRGDSVLITLTIDTSRWLAHSNRTRVTAILPPKQTSTSQPGSRRREK